ncbi:TetR family transcriptional regulator [Aureimonas endophytica]|uniref:TetR family transcriptional regulator n=1 Tax=Aureimonas endophytica TaxID=2027858 RepID=A0A917EBF5_9HYPH|nr:TetR family transcriptional regulator [Aureimonas endophytica]GGE21377.1 TetR family transcriptional regulator [Aureimonas endophytica]
MGRRRSIDRDRVLDIAEGIVAEHGAGALTIGAVAEAAGITKGGVQSCFGTKEMLIAAMLERWMAEDDSRFAALAGPDPSPRRRLRAHVETTEHYDRLAQTRVASLLATLLQTPEQVAGMRTWYAARLAGLDPDTEEGRRARLAFLAGEGAFHLRFLGLLPIDSREWREIFADIRALLDDPA